MTNAPSNLPHVLRETGGGKEGAIVNAKQVEAKQDALMALIEQAQACLAAAHLEGEREEGENMRASLSAASNAVDEAMVLIDQLLAPNPGPDDDPWFP